MSDSHSSRTTGHHQAEQSSTGGDIRIGSIVAIGVFSLALFAGGVGWAYGLMRGRQEELHAGGLPTEPTEIGKPEIGIVDQIPFEIDHRLEVWRAENARRLSSYGWIDRAKGIAHIPIEKAMEQVIASPPDIAGEGVSPVAKPPSRPAAAPSGAAVPAGSHLPHPGGTP